MIASLRREQGSDLGNGHPSVLLIEDCEDDVFFFQRALRKACSHCQLTHVGDGGSAVQLLQKTASAAGKLPDLIYLDLKMPVLNGFEVLDWIRQQPFAPWLRVVVLSGSDQEKDRQKAHALGALRYQVKPVKVQNLAEDLLALGRELKKTALSSAGQTQLADPNA